MAKSHTVLTPLHLLHALCNDQEGMVPEIFNKIGANCTRICEMAESELGRLAQGNNPGQIIMPDPALSQVVLDAQRSLLSLQDQLAVSEGEVTSDLISLYKALGGGWTSMRPVKD